MCHSLGSPTGTGTKQNYLLLSWFCGVQDNQDHSKGKKKKDKKTNAFWAVCLRFVFNWWRRGGHVYTVCPTVRSGRWHWCNKWYQSSLQHGKPHICFCARCQISNPKTKNAVSIPPFPSPSKRWADQIREALISQPPQVSNTVSQLSER